nr:trafficking protein particle complex subunit 6A isoform X6 [Symphalangus syndactylus]
MRAGSAGRIFRRARGCMADTVLFEFLHTEMVAELWAHDPDPGSGGQKMSLSVLEGMGFRVGQALGERLPRETLAFREELDVLKFLCKDLWVAVFQKQMDSLRTNHQGSQEAALGHRGCFRNFSSLPGVSHAWAESPWWLPALPTV